MSAQRIIVCAAALVFMVMLTSVGSVPDGGSYAAQNKSHHLILGYRMPGDRLVLRENIQKNSSWMKVVTVQKMFNTTRWERITMMKALDQKTNGNGAYCTLISGGPGHTNVTLKFKSKRGHGINFVVELYAR